MKRAGFLVVVTSLIVGMAFAQTTPLVQLQNWHGTLVDANCAAGAGSSSPASSDSAAAQPSKDQSGTDSTAKEGASANAGQARDQSPGTKGHRSRASAGQTQSCPVTSSTTAFALMLDDGRVMKFDFVGNARAAEELKTKPKWTKEMGEGKPIHAKISGTTAPNDTITVSDIH